MAKLEELLGKLKQSLFSHTKERERIHSIIASELGASIPDSALRIKGDTLFIDATPVQKSELLMKKERILALINEGRKAPLRDIR